MANARKIKAIKWDWNLLWHIVNNDKCLPMTKKPPWSHFFEEAKIITSNFMRRKTPFKSLPWKVQLIKVFFGIC